MPVRFVALGPCVALVLACVSIGCVSEVELGADEHYQNYFLGDDVTCRVPARRELSDTVVCLGSNAFGQLLVDPATLTESCDGIPCSSVPVTSAFILHGSLAFGSAFGCALGEEELMCFGQNRVGQLGRGTRDTVAHAIPVALLPGVDASAIGAGRHHACALAPGGDVFCWGDGTHGQLGLDPATLEDCGVVADGVEAELYGAPVGTVIRCAATPRPLPGVGRVSALWVGDFATCVRDETDDVTCVGRNRNGALGIEGEVDATHTPTRLRVRDVQHVALGPNHGCALTVDGTLSCFGSHASGQLGSEPSESCNGSPCARTAVRVATGVSAVSVGDDVTWAIDERRALLAFGADDAGQLGDGPGSPATCGDRGCARTPVRIALEHPIVHVAGGARHACVVTSADQVLCWGDGRMGATGDSLHTTVDSPTVLLGFQPPN